MPPVLDILALKWRPRTLDDFTGQQHIILVIRKMLERWSRGEVKLPPGIILTGLRGSGKTSLARVIAAYLNCEADEDKPCCECQSCIEIQSFRSASVLEIDGADKGGVDTARDLKRLTQLSHNGNYRVVVIDEVHAATKEFFSALLKQLEEPPPDVLYVLVTTNPEAIPLAIANRCLQFDYSPISASDIISRLDLVCRSEGFKFDAEVLPLIAKRAKGSMRGALMLLQQLALADEITLEYGNKLWPDTLDEFAHQFVQTAFKADAEAGNAVVAEAFIAHRDCGLLVDAITDHLRQMVIRDVLQGKSQLSLQKIANLIKIAWDLRIKLRTVQPSDPNMIYALWYMYLLELASAKAAQIGGASASRPTINLTDSLETVVAAKPPVNGTAKSEQEVIDSLLSGL